LQGLFCAVGTLESFKVPLGPLPLGQLIVKSILVSFDFLHGRPLVHIFANSTVWKTKQFPIYQIKL